MILIDVKMVHHWPLEAPSNWVLNHFETILVVLDGLLSGMKKCTRPIVYISAKPEILLLNDNRG